MARLKFVCVLFFLHFVEFSRAAERVEGTLEKIYHDKECLGPLALGMESGRISNNNIWASTYEQKRLPSQARVGDRPGSWTARTANAFQYIGIDLGERMMVTAVETQGRKGSSEYVTEYYLEFSDDRNTWRYYTNELGMRQIFTGNVDGFAKKKNTLRYPVVARYIRFNPQRWNTRISMRIELYGCEYSDDPASFSNSYIALDLSQENNQNNGYAIQTIQDTLKLRFRTDRPNGILFYADGNQGDHFALELKRGYLWLHINLGTIDNAPGENSIVGGSLLDDFQWHDVIITRDRKVVTFVVDRLETKVETIGEFYRLNLDKVIYLGGVPTFNMPGLKTRFNFHGCVENVVFDDIKIIQGAKQQLRRYSVVGPVTYNCRLSQIVPVTFDMFDSHIKASGADATDFRVSLEFRTHNTDGLLVYHVLTEGGDVRAKINEDGHVWYRIVVDNQIIEDVVRNNDIDSPTNTFNDGLWHTFLLSIDSRAVNCTVDRNSKISTRALGLKLGDDYFIGGYDTENSFLGCMRNIDVGNKIIDLVTLSSDQHHHVIIGTCGIRDRCTPNPCEHGGICGQDWKSFFCICDGTGYTGAVCHISTHPLSCMHYKMYSRSKDEEPTVIDVDGSGPLAPFPVGCDIGDALESTETYVSHDSMSSIKVDGCQNPGCYSRQVTYDAEFKALEYVIERSYACRQFINYECNNSRLLSDPDETNPDGREWLTYGWWVGRSFQPQYYWGGASPGSRRCSCGLTDTGCQESVSGQKDNVCHCDSQQPYVLSDNGYLRHKEHLPVLEMFFGDTGLVTDYKMGWHTLDRLACEGDNMFDNVITFRKRDATVELPTFDAMSSGDIWFQFKTTQRDGVILHNTGMDDYIQVRIYNGDTIQFSYNAGSGAYNLEYRAPSGLNDNNWHTAHIERNRKQAWLRVDTQRAVVRNEPEEQGYRTLDLNSPLVVGASVDNRDGFVGCIRGLMVNGNLMDLRGMVDRGEVNYGVISGCVGKCDSNPCFNGGTCKERYEGYTCDCAYTPFRGWMCGREVGVNMLKAYMIKYTFDKDNGLAAADGEYIRVGFSTKFKQGILLQIMDENSQEYISIEINNNGGVKVALDVGFGRDEVNTPAQGIDYTNGQQHEVVIRRENRGRRLIVQVDDYEPGYGNWEYLPTTADTILDNPKYLYVGRNVTTGSGLGFEGCIYRMQFDNIFPLKRAFQDPRPSFITLEPESEIREDMCGFEEITQPPDPVEIRPGAGTIVNVTQPTTFDGNMNQNSQIIIAVCVAIAFLLIMLILVIFCKLRNGGVYKTYEDEGAELADNPDTAIVYNHMGQPDVQKKREFFI